MIPREYRSDLAERFNTIIENQDVFGKTVVDIGCANGYFMARLMQAGALSVIGVDPDPQYEGDKIVRSIDDVTGTFDICLYLDLHYHAGIDYFPWIKEHAKVLFVSPSGSGNNRKLEHDLQATFGNLKNVGGTAYANRNMYKVIV